MQINQSLPKYVQKNSFPFQQQMKIIVNYFWKIFYNIKNKIKKNHY